MVHGTSKTLTVNENPPKELIGGVLLSRGDTWHGWWDQNECKWKLDYENGFVGWWDDKYFTYDGK
ncbi:hypothetical protein BSK59_13290 [Paenibacillus odorifer]|uniref:hypothetical protein n=1 Tax=Paenibacillus odorifer TaxID=189426 RepID=UPI00096F001A|nr:hypothetical protein [Paenibacillus odorifer]OME55446.1 hypothetical protein BSK59_13290 [Paenibacillus odorifer]